MAITSMNRGARFVKEQRGCWQLHWKFISHWSVQSNRECIPHQTYSDMGFVKSDCVPANPAAQAMGGKQPLTGKILPMVPEYKSKVLVLLNAKQQLAWPCLHPYLQHCKLFHSFQVVGMEGAENVKMQRTSAKHSA